MAEQNVKSDDFTGLAGAVDRVRVLADQARRPTVLRLPEDPAHVSYLCAGDGSVKRVEATPGDRTITLATLDDLIALAKSPFDTAVKEAGRQLVVYHAGGVSLIFDHWNGRERAVVQLHETDEWGFFEERGANPVVSVSALRQALRSRLRECLSEDHLAKLVQQVSQMDTQAVAAGQVSVARGKESLGQSVLQQVVTTEMPEELQTFSVRRYANPDLNVRHPLTCLLDPETASRQWRLEPVEGSWLEAGQRAVDLVGARLREALNGSGVPVYQGTYEQ
jgi:hypothetical protein